MKQKLQSLKTGAVELVEAPVPALRAGYLLIATPRSMISPGRNGCWWGSIRQPAGEGAARRSGHFLGLTCQGGSL